MGEIAEVIGGGTPRTSDPSNFEDGDIPWITPADLSGYANKYISGGSRFITQKGLDSSSTRLLPAGAVLFTSRAPIGYVAIARNQIATNQGFKSFILRDGVLPEYVYWWLKGSKRIAEGLASGTTFLEISGANAKKIPIPIVSLERQREIVTEVEKQFSRLDEAVANLKRVKAKLKRYKAAVLNAAVEGRLVPIEAVLGRLESRSYETGTQLLQRVLETRRSRWKGRGKYKEPAAQDTGAMPELPEGWAWATVEQLTWLVTSGSRGWGDFYSKAGALFIRAQDIKTDALTLATVARVDVPAGAEGIRSRVDTNDILITITGANVTKSALVPSLPEHAFVSQHVAVLKLNLPEISFFAIDWIVSPSNGRRTLEAWAYGAGKPGLSLEQVRALLVALPPLLEQHRIVAELDRRMSLIRQAEAVVEANLTRATSLRASVLKLAFTAG